MKTLKDKLKVISGPESSDWRTKVQNRKNNPWLREYSSEIARRILIAMKKKDGLTQIKLAETLGVSPQQVNKIVKGYENLTLETIYKLSKALDVELISFPDYELSEQPETEKERHMEIVKHTCIQPEQKKQKRSL